MEKQSNAIVKSKTPQQKQDECEDFLQGVWKYYGMQPDPFRLAMDGETLEKYPVEQLRAAFRGHLADPSDCKFPPKPGDLIKRIPRVAENLGGNFTPPTDAEKHAALEAKNSPEAKKFHEVLELVGKGMKVETSQEISDEDRRGLLKRQAEQGK